MAAQVQVEQVVRAAPEVVWEVLTDLDGAPRFLTAVVATQRLAGEGWEVGTRWRETRRMFGREGAEEMVVQAVEPPRRTVVGAESGGVRYETTFLVAPDPAGSRVTMAFTASAEQAPVLTRVLAATVGRLALRATQRACRQDLADVATEAQARAGA